VKMAKKAYIMKIRKKNKIIRFQIPIK